MKRKIKNKNLKRKRENNKNWGLIMMVKLFDYDLKIEIV